MLREITAETVRAVMKLSVTESQNRFVAPNAWSLGQALFAREAWYRSMSFRPTGEIDEGEVVMALALDAERPSDAAPERAETDLRWSTLHWSIGDALPRDDVGIVSARVLELGRSLAADGNARPLACLVRDGIGAVVAGASGRTEYARLFVNNLWVDEALRGAGIGSELLRCMEQAALARGCDSAMLETLGERACALYRRVGYEPVAHVTGCVGPFDRVILLKPLARAAA